MASDVHFDASMSRKPVWQPPVPDHIISPQEQLERLLDGRDEVSLNMHRVCRNITEQVITPTGEQLRLLVIKLMTSGYDRHVESTPALAKKWQEIQPYVGHPANWPDGLNV